MNPRCCSQICSGLPNAFVDMLNEATVNVDEAPLGQFEYNETDCGVDGGGDDEEEVDEMVMTSQGIKWARAVNYTVVEDEALIKAWETISLDSIHGADQTGKRYWQRVQGKFFQLMPKGRYHRPTHI